MSTVRDALGKSFGVCPAHPLLEAVLTQLVDRVDVGFRDQRAELASHRQAQADQIERGFAAAGANMQARVDALHNEVLVTRGEMNDRITDITGHFNRIHERIDEHIEKQHGMSSRRGLLAVPAKPGSDPRLPAGVAAAQRWITFALEAGALCSGLGVILYFFYRAAEAGLFK